MCNVCCAGTAIENTAKGSWFQATWSTKSPPRGERKPRAVILNSPTAPPSSAPLTALADLRAGTEPYLLIQAEGEEEGPGRVRYGFDGETWTMWTATQDVASEMMNSDVVWSAVPDDVRAPVLARDVAGLELLLLRRAMDDLQFEVGWRITAGLPQDPGRAGVQDALLTLRTRVQRELDGLDLSDDSRALLLDLRSWRPRQPFPRSPEGLRRALLARLAPREGWPPVARGLACGVRA